MISLPKLRLITSMDLYSGRPLESTTDHRPHYHEASLTNMSKPGDNVIIRDDLSIMLPCCVVVSDWQATLSSSILQCFDEGRFCDMTFKFSSNEVLQVMFSFSNVFWNLCIQLILLIPKVVWWNDILLLVLLPLLNVHLWPCCLCTSLCFAEEFFTIV